MESHDPASRFVCMGAYGPGPWGLRGGVCGSGRPRHKRHHSMSTSHNGSSGVEACEWAERFRPSCEDSYAFCGERCTVTSEPERAQARVPVDPSMRTCDFYGFDVMEGSPAVAAFLKAPSSGTITGNCHLRAPSRCWKTSSSRFVNVSLFHSGSREASSWACCRSRSTMRCITISGPSSGPKMYLKTERRVPERERQLFNEETREGVGAARRTYTASRKMLNALESTSSS